MCLTGQFFDAHIGKDGGQGIGRVKVARPLAADVEHHGNRERTKAFGLEVVSAQDSQVAQRRFGIVDDGRRKGRRSQRVQFLRRDAQRVPEKRQRKFFPVARLPEPLNNNPMSFIPKLGRQANPATRAQ